MAFHTVVCVDANFEQRRCATAGGSIIPIPHPQTVFLPPSEVLKTKLLVESRRKDKKGSSDEDENQTLKGLALPNYIYEECTSRFIAANESNKKAEASVYSDTGLMALTCRHDHVLFMVNLQDAGEKQYNALALLDRLFSELPSLWHLGVLYDIGCQMHKSLIKVQFLINLIPEVKGLLISVHSTTFWRSILTGWISLSHAFMHLHTNLPVNVSTILKSASYLAIVMGKAVNDAGLIFRS